MRRSIIALGAFFAISSAWAEPQINLEDVHAFIEEIVELPGEGVRIIRTADGELLAMVGQRFVIRGGVLYDGWQRNPTELYSMAEVRKAAMSLDLEALGMDLASMRPLTLGQGQSKAVLIVDPTCPHSAALLKEIRADHTLLEKYQFQILVIPVLGPQSEEPVRRLECTPDPKRAVSALLEGRYQSLPVSSHCDLGPAQTRIGFFQALGLKGTPMMIAPDHRYTYGTPQDIHHWLEGNKGG